MQSTLMFHDRISFKMLFFKMLFYISLLNSSLSIHNGQKWPILFCWNKRTNEGGVCEEHKALLVLTST